MQIRLAETDEEIARCFPVMVQVRSHLAGDGFVAQVRRQARHGYRLLYAEEHGRVTVIAGFRVQEMTAFGVHLHVDDLATDAAERSKGHGGALLDWLVDHARSLGCRSVQLDSGVQRADAHRFYFRQRMHISAYHFVIPLTWEAPGVEASVGSWFATG